TREPPRQPPPLGRGARRAPPRRQGSARCGSEPRRRWSYPDPWSSDQLPFQACHASSISSKFSPRYASLKYAEFSSALVTERSATIAGLAVDFVFVGPYGMYWE